VPLYLAARGDTRLSLWALLGTSGERAGVLRLERNAQRIPVLPRLAGLGVLDQDLHLDVGETRGDTQNRGLANWQALSTLMTISTFSWFKNQK